MNYEETIDYLYTRHPAFQRIGAGAYKPGLGTAHALDMAFGCPHAKYPTIHIAGTNGKGSTAHTLAAILQSAGYRTGLYTSPHLFDFRERIRVNGQMIPRETVVDFVARYRDLNLDVDPSFFELTMTMAFDWFAAMHVDVAVIETGLGGRLDSTNIITPCLSVITNISKDHTAFLGDTLVEIAAEKAGIIKPGVPVVIGEAEGDVRQVFVDKAAAVGAPITFAQPVEAVMHDDYIEYPSTPYGRLHGELTGIYQVRNTATILAALDCLTTQFDRVDNSAVADGMAHVVEKTGLMGRWMKVGDSPRVICDTGHNEGGWQYISRQLRSAGGRHHLIIGFVNDKDVSAILDSVATIPDTEIYMTRPSVERGMPVSRLARLAAEHGITGKTFPSLQLALNAAKSAVKGDETILIAGSNFLISDLNTDKIMKTKGVLFDLDGVLIDSEGEYSKFWAETGRKYGVPDPDFAANIKGATLTKILTYFRAEDRDAVVQEIHDFEKQMRYPLFPGVEDFLKELKRFGIPAAVVTSSDDVKMSYLFAAHPEFKDYFSAFVTGSQVKKSKPDPEGYLTGARAIGVAPENCFVFEDSIQGLQAGLSSGAAVIGLATTNPVEKVSPLCHKVIRSFEDFTVDEMLSVQRCDK
ncbi:MAG TPA: hypothetical protein DDY12_08250 [Porphyromonadaceae bacterium]|nr:hypothetical protein [Porphyromonadaceae bacterium]